MLNNLENVLESILLIAGNPVSASEIAEKLAISREDVLSAAKNLQDTKYTEESGIKLNVFGDKLQFATNAAYADPVAEVLNPIREKALSKSMLETVAIVAYKQPVSRLDLEEIRGMNSEYALQKLLEINLIEVVGRKDALGRPALFGTTDEFLKRFELTSLNDLPDYETILQKIRAQEVGTADENSNYLYRREEYVSEIAPTDDEIEEIQEEISFDDDDIPDFIKEEELIHIE